jgi:hypothetical protein
VRRRRVKRRLTLQDRHYIKGQMEGLSIYRAALAAGFTLGMAINACKKLMRNLASGRHWIDGCVLKV